MSWLDPSTPRTRRPAGSRTCRRRPATARARRTAAKIEREVERQLQLVVLPVERGERASSHPGLAQQQPRRRVAVGDRAPVPEDGVRLRPVGAVHRPLAEPAGQRAVAAAAGRRAVRVLVEAVRDVDAEPGDPPVEPEPEDLAELRVHGGLPPVQVRLAGQEIVQVVLAAGVVERQADWPVASASCWGPAARRRGQPTRSTHGAPSPGPPGRPRTRGERCWCGWAPGPAAPACPAGPPPPPAGPGRPSCRGRDARQGSRRRRSPSPDRATASSATARRRPPPATTGSRARDDPAQVAVPVAVGVPPRPDIDLVQGGAMPPVRARRRLVHVPPRKCEARNARSGRRPASRLPARPNWTGVSPVREFGIAVVLATAAGFALIGAWRAIRVAQREPVARRVRRRPGRLSRRAAGRPTCAGCARNSRTRETRRGPDRQASPGAERCAAPTLDALLGGLPAAGSALRPAATARRWPRSTGWRRRCGSTAWTSREPAAR